MSQQKLLSQIRNPSKPSHYVYPGISSRFFVGAQQVVEDIVTLYGSPLPVADGINRIIESVYNINPNLLQVKNRKEDIVLPRQVGMMLFRLANYSLAKSGAAYGKDHATALHGIKKKCYPILETKTPKDEYHNLVCAIKAFNILYPQYSLSDLPRGWDNPNQPFRKSHPGHREQHRAMPTMQG